MLWFFWRSKWMWELDHKEALVPNNWCFRVVVLERTLQSLSDCTEIKPVNPKRNQPWILTARTDAEAETPIVWLLDAKSQFIGKNPDAGKDWKKEEKGTTEDKITVWQLNGHEFEQAPGDSEGYLGSLACCSPWGHKDSETTEGLNNNNPSLHINMPLFLRVGLPGWP